MAKSTVCRTSAETALRLFRFAVAGVLILFSPATLAGGFSEVKTPDCSGEAVSQNQNTGQGSLKGFADPDTGEIITYEEARRTGIADYAREESSGEARATAEVVREIRLGRRVPLEGGGYIAEVVSPRPRAELKAKISSGGATEILCHKRAGKASSLKGGGRE